MGLEPDLAKVVQWKPNAVTHRLPTPNEGITKRYLKNWADVADKICFGRT